MLIENAVALDELHESVALCPGETDVGERETVHEGAAVTVTVTGAYVLQEVKYCVVARA